MRSVRCAQFVPPLNTMQPSLGRPLVTSGATSRMAREEGIPRTRADAHRHLRTLVDARLDLIVDRLRAAAPTSGGRHIIRPVLAAAALGSLPPG
jgi:hypothetical protein